MTNPVWRNGPPPSLGWWPASMSQIPTIYRWWNGKRWSAPVGDYSTAVEAGNAASQSTLTDEIQWHARPTNWPARSMT